MSEQALIPPHMTSEAFLEWSMRQPEGARYELEHGEVVRMASERAAHARTKFRVAELMSAAIREGGLACEMFTDGMAVRVDASTVYEPDAQLRCRARVPDDTVVIDDPLVVVEVVSPSSQAVDTGAKLADYFRIPSVRHYLVVRTKDRTVIQHTRAMDGTILTRIVREGPILLDPPGINLVGLFA